jgi:hypothetical protein
MPPLTLRVAPNLEQDQAPAAGPRGSSFKVGQVIPGRHRKSDEPERRTVDLDHRAGQVPADLISAFQQEASNAIAHLWECSIRKGSHGIGPTACRPSPPDPD